MVKLFNISRNLILEQNSKITALRNSILNKKPISIYYVGPYPEVYSGDRYEIAPIIMGSNSRSGNLVVWAYVTKGTSKKGLPGWKMFRVDRIRKIKDNPNAEEFDLNSLPEYVAGKAPGMMKSLSSVDVYSPYLSDKEKTEPTPIPQKTEPEPTEPEVTKPEPEPTEPEPTEPETQPGQGEIPVEKPDMKTDKFNNEIFNTSIVPKVKEINGQKTISRIDYENAVKELYRKKENEWRNYQRKLTGNIKAGEGTRFRFDRESKNEIDHILDRQRIKIVDQNTENLSEIIKRFKRLIN